MDLVPIRPEVIEAMRSRRAGAIVLARPVPMKVAAGFGGAVVVAVALLLAFGEYTSKVRVSGHLEPVGGAIKVVAGQSGRISVRHVREGDTVKAGQLLFELSAERIDAAGSIDARVGAAIDVRRDQIALRRDVSIAQLRQSADALVVEQRRIDSTIATCRANLGIADQQVTIARANARRYAELAKQGFAPQVQAIQAQSALGLEQARRNAAALTLSDAHAALARLRQQAAAVAGEIKLATSEARQGIAALAQEAAEHDGRRATSVVAPAAGRVTTFAYSVGQTVPAGTVLATVLPAGAVLEARLLVPSHAKAALLRGQRVQLRIDAFPYQKYGLVAGTVAQVESSPITELPPGSAPGAMLYRASVTLSTDALMMYGRRTPFETGMTLQADIFNDRRRLIEWVVDPLASAAKGRAP
jgi:membrane fusion protein